MLLTGQRLYIVVHRAAHTERPTVRILKRLGDAYKGWTYLSRISPIFPAVRSASGKPKLSRKTNYQLTFLGPVPPWRVAECSALEDEVFITLGTFNVILRTDANRKDPILKWARSNAIPFESWSVCENVVVNETQSPPPPPTECPRYTREATSLQIPAEVTTFAEEYVSLISTAQLYDAIRGKIFDEVLSGVAQFIVGILSELKRPGGTAKVLEDIGILNVTNNGLAQMEAQACRNISPIVHNPSAPSSHSLLGLGAAIRAISNLAVHIRMTLGAERIPQRFARLARTKSFPHLDQLSYDEGFWYRDHLAGTTLTATELSEPLTPLVPYLSDCDHYRTTLTTLSTPLNIVNACNTNGWTLMTITHEMCHSIIRGVLGYLVPGAINSKDYAAFRRCADLYNNIAAPSTLAEEITRFLLIALLGMEHVDNLERQQNPDHISAPVLLSVVDNWIHDAEEVMVHVLDFLYFYNGILDRYITSVWRSWSVIPAIRNRIPEYVLRTLCAARASTLRHTNGIPMAYRMVADVLKTIDSSPYAAEALKYLDAEWEKSLNQKLSVREPLIRIVSTFLYSQGIAGQLHDETQFASNAPSRAGYSLSPQRFSEELIDNPLKFIEVYTGDDRPSGPRSAWLLSTLAFNVSTANVKRS
jgi:hypothetical protein